MYFANFSQQTGIVPIFYSAHPLEIVPLVTHYCLHLKSLCGFQQGSGLPDIVCKRFLRVNRNSKFHCSISSCKMGMIGCVYNNQIQLFMMNIKHLSEVFISLGAWKSLKSNRSSFIIYFGYCHNIFKFAIFECSFGNSSTAN